MNRLLVLALAVLALLPACGGGSTGYTPTPSASPVPPVKLAAGIYRLPRDGAEPILEAAEGDSFSISRDLRWLAFTTESFSSPKVHLVDLENGESWVVTAQFQGVYGFAVAPDGRQVVVLGRLDTVKGIYSIDATTGAVTKPVPIRNNQPIGSLEWSPTGGLFAFVGAPGERPPGLYIADPSTWDSTLVAKTPSDQSPRSLGDGPRVFSWSADSASLAVSSPYGEDRGLFVADVRSGEVQKASDALLLGGRLTWSPDGTRIAFSSGPTNGPVGRYGSQLPQVFVLDLSSGEETVLTEGYDPAWSPDGDEIAFVHDGGLYAIAASGDGERPIGPFAVSRPEWLADGSLMFVSGAIQ